MHKQPLLADLARLDELLAASFTTPRQLQAFFQRLAFCSPRLFGRVLDEVDFNGGRKEVATKVVVQLTADGITMSPELAVELYEGLAREVPNRRRGIELAFRRDVADVLARTDLATRAIDWQAGEDESLEVYLGPSSTLLDMGFLERAQEVGRAVFRLRAEAASGVIKSTAFRVGERSVLTCHHAVHHARVFASRLHLDLDFQLDGGGELSKQIRTVTEHSPQLLLSRRSASPALDFALIALSEPLADDIPILPLPADARPSTAERAYIIQHPEGAEKKIGLNRNVIRHVTEEIIQYLTDTACGSSGAPVFDDHWQLIGMHYRFVPCPEEQRFGKRNEAMRIDRVRQEIDEAQITIV